MKSWDEIEEDHDKLTNLWAEEVWKEATQTMREMDEYHNFLNLWVKVLEENDFEIDSIKTKWKGKEEWDLT